MNDLQSTLIADVIATERKWAEAHGQVDLDTIADILSEDNRQIQSDGTVIGKKELIESYQSGGRMWEVAESSGYSVRLFGDVALLIDHWRGKGVNEGKDFDYSARFLAVYVLEDGAWKLVSDISVPLGE